MVNESFTFGLATVLLLGGLAVMLFGVSLNAGQALNAPLIAGGIVIVAAIGILSAGILGLDEA